MPGLAYRRRLRIEASEHESTDPQYLVDQLAAKSNVHIETGVEVVGVEGRDSLEAIEVAAGPSRRRERRPSDGLFILIGGRAETSWLPASVIRDRWGYICTGRIRLPCLSEAPV